MPILGMENVGILGIFNLIYYLHISTGYKHCCPDHF